MVETRHKAYAESEASSPKVGKKATTPKSSGKKSKRKQAKEELKSKNTGVGLKIEIGSETKNNKKIVFDDNVDLDEEEQVPEIEDSADNRDEVIDQKGDNDSDDDDDDDAVEEVKGTAAREEMLEKMKEEEDVARRLKKKKKRKQKKKEEQSSDEDEDHDDEADEFDDDFFQQLAIAKAQEAKEKPKKQRKGKRTAFVFENDNETESAPRDLDHNIQVVVLSNPAHDNTSNAIAAVPVNALSEEALVYSRNRLTNGSDVDGPPRKKLKSKPEGHWKRSKKMNLIAAGRSKRRGFKR